MMEQGKSLSRKIALITLSEPWSFIRQIQVLETKQTEGAMLPGLGSFCKRQKTPISKAVLFCRLSAPSKRSVPITEVILLDLRENELEAMEL